MYTHFLFFNAIGTKKTAKNSRLMFLVEVLLK